MKTVEPGQTVVIRTNDAYDGAHVVVQRIWSSGDISVAIDDGEPFCVSPREIVGIETHTCERCGATVTALDGHCETYHDYRWDGSDGEGSVLYEFTRWTCRDLTGCAQRRRTQAQAAMAQADTADAVARESGYGAIRYF